MKELRQKQIKARKNFLPTLVLTVFLWTTLAGIIYFVSPDTFGIIPLFFVLVFFALLFTSSLTFANTRRGVITSLGITLFLILRSFGVGNILNFLIIAGLAITIELYFIRTN